MKTATQQSVLTKCDAVDEISHSENAHIQATRLMHGITSMPTMAAPRGCARRLRNTLLAGFLDTWAIDDTISDSRLLFITPHILHALLLQNAIKKLNEHTQMSIDR